MNKPHIHAELIKAWADGAEIEYFSLASISWAPLKEPLWGEGGKYRIKPTTNQGCCCCKKYN